MSSDHTSLPRNAQDKGKRQTIFRIKRHTSDFFLYHRQTAQDRNLSLEARGMLAYLLSKPEDWEVQPGDLEQGCSRGKVYKIMRELKNAGYMREVIERDKKGYITDRYYEVYEVPQLDPVLQDQVPTRSSEDLIKLEHDNVKRHAYKRENLQNTDSDKSVSLPETHDPIKEYPQPFVAAGDGATDTPSKSENFQESGETTNPPPNLTTKAKKQKTPPKYTQEENRRRADIALAHCKYLGMTSQNSVGIARHTTDKIANEYPDLTGAQYQAFLEWYCNTYKKRDEKLRKPETIIGYLAEYLSQQAATVEPESRPRPPMYSGVTSNESRLLKLAQETLQKELGTHFPPIKEVHRLAYQWQAEGLVIDEND